MRFSIIICTYNAAKKLPKTLDSILTQTFGDFEVVIVDGASTDGTVGVIKEYEEKFAGKLRWLSEKDAGIYEAMNKGVRMAQGEYLNVVGAGDWLEKGALGKASECIAQNPKIDAVHGKLRIWDKDLKKSYLLQSFPKDLTRSPMQHPALYYKKTLHDKYGLYDETYKIVSDYLFCMKAFGIGKAEVVAFDDVVDNYVTDGISSTETLQCEMENERARSELGLNPLVSIIMPTYNQKDYIKETLDSVLAQIYPDWECVIVDDGSTDGTAEVVGKYVERDKRFKYIRQENSGPSEARNNGILHSHGEYILPLDSDDLISPRYIRDAVDFFIKNPETKLVYCKSEYFGEKSGEVELLDYSYEKILFFNMIFCSAIYRRVDYDKTKGYNGNMKNGLEDWDFWLTFLQEKDIVHRLPITHFFYRIKKGSRNHNSHSDMEIVKQMHRQIFLNHLEKYMDIINPIQTEHNIEYLNKNISEKESEIDVLKKRNSELEIELLKLKKGFSGFVLRSIEMSGVYWQKISFALFSPKKFLKKYFLR
ncbi:MAG TPA: glycosyltransferase [Patescibacteria group bacterium]